MFFPIVGFLIQLTCLGVMISIQGLVCFSVDVKKDLNLKNAFFFGTGAFASVPFGLFASYCLIEKTNVIQDLSLSWIAVLLFWISACTYASGRAALIQFGGNSLPTVNSGFTSANQQNGLS